MIGLSCWPKACWDSTPRCGTQEKRHDFIRDSGTFQPKNIPKYGGVAQPYGCVSGHAHTRLGEPPRCESHRALLVEQTHLRDTKGHGSTPHSTLCVSEEDREILRRLE
ncbi:hypothetical protein Q8A67_022129 [Cirrhinus molitorella]|uniref:Uncharacterized protein n=1 Tax=Cirrhinus molitorella TaxID=172907 RepID=A0AA88P848_9TELE|nr:hypothetical protein Q8A67_022129 [Cirrhinus molitorella]